jgi:hypothetical protein
VIVENVESVPVPPLLLIVVPAPPAPTVTVVEDPFVIVNFVPPGKEVR